MVSPVTTDSMNWLIVVMAGVFVIIAGNWVLSGQYSFKGPKRDIVAPTEATLKAHNEASEKQ